MPTKLRKFGDLGEDIAANFLRQKGYIIVERNFLVREGEIDLVAENENEDLIFIEVKARRNTSFGEIAESVTSEKQEKLCRTAYKYLQVKDIDSETHWRIDVVTVDFSKNPPYIEHFENAFE